MIIYMYIISMTGVVDVITIIIVIGIGVRCTYAKEPTHSWIAQHHNLYINKV